MTSAPTQVTDEQLFLVVGEFFVTFSHLMSITECVTAALISKGGEEEAFKRARIALSHLTAKPLSNAFFSVLKEFETQNWTATDHAILKRARTEMDSLIEQRNRFAHDTWHLGHPNLARPSADSWHTTRTIGTPSAGLRVDFAVQSVESIRSLIRQTKRVGANIRQLSLAGIAGDTCRPELQLRITSTELDGEQVSCIRDHANG